MMISSYLHQFITNTHSLKSIIYRVIYSRREEKQSRQHMQCTIHDSSPLKDPYCTTIIPSPKHKHPASFIILHSFFSHRLSELKFPRLRRIEIVMEGSAFGPWIWGSSPSKTKRHFICGETRELDGFFLVLGMGVTRPWKIISRCVRSIVCHYGVHITRSSPPVSPRSSCFLLFHRLFNTSP